MTRATAGRVILASGFAAAIAISPMLVVLGPTAATAIAACPGGESEDPYTLACVPDIAPNSVGGAPSESQLTQCTGGDQGECLEGDLYPPAPVARPNTTVQQSP